MLTSLSTLSTELTDLEARVTTAEQAIETLEKAIEDLKAADKANEETIKKLEEAIADGKSIASVAKTSEGLIDTYVITYTDTTYSFTVTNGIDGKDASMICVSIAITIAVVALASNLCLIGWIILKRKKNGIDF